jgi:hypothetical protein
MRLWKFLPDTYRGEALANLKAILGAISEADDAIESLLVEGRKQLFLTSAQGKYLVDLASQYGFSLPRNAGFDTTGIRNLAIPAVFLPKQTAYTANRIIETFYSVDVLHPSFLSTQGEPFNLADGDNLILQTISGTIEIVFRASQVGDITNVTAGEIAGIINSQQQTVFADTYYDRLAGTVNVRLTSFAYGANATLKVAGGTAQNILRFPQIRDCAGDSTTVWSIDKEQGKSYAGQVTFTYVSGTQPSIWNLRAGDLLTVRGLTDNSVPWSYLNGSYNILDVGRDYFVIQNLQFAPVTLPVTLLQPDSSSMVFTSAQARTLYDNQEWALVTETRQNELDISIPVVPPVIKRTLKGSAHLHGTSYIVQGFSRSSVTIKKNTELPSSGDFVFTTAVFSNAWNRDHQLSYDSLIHTPTTTQIFLTSNSKKFPFMTESESNVIGGAGIVNPLVVPIGGSEATVVTPGVEHGFENGQEFNVSNVSFSTSGNPVIESRDGGLALSDFNGVHTVKRVVDKYSYTFDLKDALGNVLVYDGTVVSGFSVYTEFDALSIDPNVRFEFSSESNRVLAGFKTGMTVKLIETGVILNTGIMKILANEPMIVVRQEGASVYLKHSKYFFTGLVATNTKCKRDGDLGNGDFRHWLITPFNTDSVNSNRDVWFKNATVTLLTAQKSSNTRYVGSYIYDPVGTYAPFVVSAVSCDLVNSVRQNESPGRIRVTSIDGFDDSGEIFIDYGAENIEGPIQYVAIEGTNPYYIVLNKAYVFKKAHAAGSECRLSRSNKTISLLDDGSQYPAYITGVTKARESIEAVLKSLIATGVKINITARPPELRYIEASIDPWS